MFAVPENTIALPETAGRLAKHPVRIALDYAVDRDRWRTSLRYDPDHRFATLIDRTDGDEVWLLSWLPGQHAVMHDHGDAVGAFTVVSGHLTESVTRRAPAGRVVTEVHNLAQGQSRVFGPGYAHEVRNDGPDPAISIHVYRAAGRTTRPVHVDPFTAEVRPT
ncbi:cysteine dioxygenase [Saccharomonospora sp. CUA-673]|uniref:cysteine dioxygenase n=1 Tax=Saccharomonospora sp. CUA-673 TaxID=1904969 RepID=UPI000967C82B|nr:cysteine dioxygenase family protein [Saccharomonospora sp. CUA-673]OLT46239.1 cysteine dioxygenase [Saccharomonospora sp. CUA-673]